MPGKRTAPLRVYVFANPDGLHDFAVAAPNLKAAVAAVVGGDPTGQVGYFRRHMGTCEPAWKHESNEYGPLYRVVKSPGVPHKRACLWTVNPDEWRPMPNR